MLEKTGSGLKSCSCSLQRATKRSSRQLHTGFWQHGALALELASIWGIHDGGRASEGPDPCAIDFTPSWPWASPSSSSSSSSSSSTSTSSSSSSSSTGLSASAFLLDFLYPSATRKFLQRLVPLFARLQDGSIASRRRYLTSSTAEETRPQSHDGFHEALEPSHARTLERQRIYQPRQVKQALRAVSAGSLNVTVAPPISIKSTTTSLATDTPIQLPVQAEARARAKAEADTRTSSLADLLSRQQGLQCGDAWDAYCRLDRGVQPRFRRDMVLYLSKSHGVVDIGRAISLFRKVRVKDWDNELLAAGVSALVRSGDLETAIERLDAGFQSNRLTGGLQHVLINTMIHRQWALLVRVWSRFCALLSKDELEGQIGNIAFEHKGAASDLESLYFSFEQYLVTEGAKSLRAINRHEESRLGFEALRRKLAQLAIMQSSQPKQAAGILGVCGDPGLYHDYLLHAVSRWEETDLRSSVTWLVDIYKSYGEIPSAQPSISLLQGLFNLFYPDNVAGLEQVYKDWHRAWGGLDQWGYEKFLKFYAGTGDVQAVQGLWKRYVASYPKVLRRPRAFRSTMNAFAQAGDAAGAEKEIRRMTDEYGIEPDLDTWNTLLKCYVRTENYQRVVACFEEICKLYRPDSYTYAHAMTMSAKEGDLEGTLELFSRSQRDRVPVSREIAMSLVMVCCRNDRLLDAERILNELAARGVTSTVMWNQLIHFNGMQGKLKKCYELLQSMKSYDVPWDHQTHEFLLQALVRVNQVQPAYRLLRSALEEKVFPVGPEHFSIVMAGALRTGEFSLVELIASQLAQACESKDFSAQTVLATAAFQKSPAAPRTRELGQELIEILQAMRGGHRGGDLGSGFVAPVAGDLQYLRKQTRHIGRAVRLLVELRDFPSAEELVNLYASIVRKHKGEGEPFPPEIASALMVGYLQDRKFKQVYKLWNLTWESVYARSKRQPSAGGVYPAHQYDLTRPFSIVAQAYREQNNGEGLLECVRRVTLAGFKLTRSNWNLTIQCLAELGQWEPAMDWCEKLLMPRWRGWAPTKRSLHERRTLKNTRILQASRTAVLSLQRQWLKLCKLAAWSPAVSVKLKQVEKLYPRLHHAFVTTGYAHLTLSWEWEGRKGVSLRKGAAGLIRPFAHKELRSMERVLDKRLKADRTAKAERIAKRKAEWAALRAQRMRERRAKQMKVRPVSQEAPISIAIP